LGIFAPTTISSPAHHQRNRHPAIGIFGSQNQKPHRGPLFPVEAASLPLAKKPETLSRPPTQPTDPAISPSTDYKQHNRTTSSPPTRERAEPFPISSDPRLPLQPAGLSFLSRRTASSGSNNPAAPSTGSPWSCHRPPETEEEETKNLQRCSRSEQGEGRGADLKTKLKQTCLLRFGCFAGNGVAHSRQEGEEGRKPLRISPRSLDFAAAREPTRRQ